MTRSNNRSKSPRNKVEMIDTPKVPVGSTYHGVTVTEDYRWLEDAESDQTRSWTKAQDRRTRSYLENLPFRDAVRRRVAEVLTAEPVRYDPPRQVPVTLIVPRGTPRDGTAPALLTGYGGFGISLKPRFDPGWVPWLEQGGVVAVAHTRGGGEYGEDWHHAGRLAAKQNVFDDFAGCARFLIESHLTTSERLAILGGSNGGLLMGAMLTQHPGLSRAVVAMVPVMDMLRVELDPNGTFNVAEYGTVNDPELFHALRAYSPYHNVKDGTAYPAVLLTAGESDPFAKAYHAKKMAARLQAATSASQPVLLRVRPGGHGPGSPDQRVSELADIYAFLFDRLSINYRHRKEGARYPARR
jgi:prolyl oligopeptidase